MSLVSLESERCCVVIGVCAVYVFLRVSGALDCCLLVVGFDLRFFVVDVQEDGLIVFGSA